VVQWVVLKKIRLELNPDELKVLTTLAENQFFRMKYIDTRLPGYRIEPERFKAAQSAVAMLSEAMKKQRGFLAQPGSNN
jgi:hypothetical protein